MVSAMQRREQGLVRPSEGGVEWGRVGQAFLRQGCGNGDLTEEEEEET